MNANPAASWPPELAKAFSQKVLEFWGVDKRDDYENPDNFREARVGDLLEELAYQKAEAQGCCGSFEIEWELCGVKVRYGFNYGH